MRLVVAEIERAPLIPLCGAVPGPWTRAMVLTMAIALMQPRPETVLVLTVPDTQTARALAKQFLKVAPYPGHRVALA